MSSVLLGGSPTPILVLGGGLHLFSGMSQSYEVTYGERYSPGQEYTEEGDLEDQVGIFIMGFAQIFFSRQGSFYLRPGGGLGGELHDDDGNGGFFATLGLGYDFPVGGGQWWLGPSAQILYLSGSYEESDYEGSHHLWTACAGLGVTMH